MPWQIKIVDGKGAYVVDDKGKKYSEKPLPIWKAKAQIKALNASASKEVALYKRANQVQAAIEKTLNPPPPPMPSMVEMRPCWVRDVYDTFAIVDMDGKTYQMDYSIDDAGVISLGELVEVEQDWKPVGKALASFKAALMKDGLPASAYMVVEDPEKVTTWSLPVKDAEGKPDHRLMGGAWAALHGGYRGNKYEGPSKADAIAKLKKLYAAENMSTPAEKSFHTFKQADGSYRWVTISSNSFKDRDGEIITTEALAADVDRCNETKEYGPLRWWHIGGFEHPDGPMKWQTWKAGPGIDLGVCDFNMLHGKMLIESGTFNDANIGAIFSEIQDELEVSIQFSHPLDEPGKKKEYKNIHRFERSLLPTGMASNMLTKFVVQGEPTMKAIESKLAALKAIFKGHPELAQQILKDTEGVQKAAEEAGLESKEVTEMIAGEPEPEAVVPEPELDVIGDMSKAELATTITEIVKPLLTANSAEAETKQAGTEAILTDALTSIKSIAARLEAMEKIAAETKANLAELTDARPVGIKQLQNSRPTESKENVIATAPVGPKMDPDFMKLLQGGK